MIDKKLKNKNTFQRFIKKWGIPIAVLFVATGIVGGCLAGIFIIKAYDKLPSVDALTNYAPKIPLRIYTSDGVLIGEFGKEKRHFIPISEIPESLKNAIISAEDERFYTHQGIDYIGIIRAFINNLLTQKPQQGASTITQQVARNFYLSFEKTLTRKLYEAMLAYKIENSLSKDQILEIYLNKIYLGERSYGFQTASLTYFSKNLEDLTLAEISLLAGIPSAPSNNNPIANLEKAKMRQYYVLFRMKVLGYITEKEKEAALAYPIVTNKNYLEDQNKVSDNAAYVAEMARQVAYDLYKDEAYTNGIKVFTTIRSLDQELAYRAVRKGVLDYDLRHGYRGSEGFIDISNIALETIISNISSLLKDYRDSNDLQVAITYAATPSRLHAVLKNGDVVTIEKEGLAFAKKHLLAQPIHEKGIYPGSVIRVIFSDEQWKIRQLPQIESAFISGNPNDGAIYSLIGGFDFQISGFNRAVQAWRQPGSTFKPFIYSAALEKDYSPSSLIYDEFLDIPEKETDFKKWNPKNFDGQYDGLITMRESLVRSRNLSSVRIIRDIGPKYARNYITRFGFDSKKHPAVYAIILGSGLVTPWSQFRAYSVFANGGYLVQPYFITKITNSNDEVLAQPFPQQSGSPNLQVLDPRNAWLIHDMLNGVTKPGGTASKVSKILKRDDFSGKTGTTNNGYDAWFVGYNPIIAAVSWIGFDSPSKMGYRETGSYAALPIWLNYMAPRSPMIPRLYRKKPDGLTPVSVVNEKGYQTKKTDYLYKEHAESFNPLPPDFFIREAEKELSDYDDDIQTNRISPIIEQKKSENDSLPAIVLPGGYRY